MSNYKRKLEPKKEVPNIKTNKEITKTESYGKIDMNKYKIKNNEINIKEKIEINEDNKDKENYINIKINKKNKNEISDTKFQESDNNASSWVATLSGTNTKKNIFPFK